MNRVFVTKFVSASICIVVLGGVPLRADEPPAKAPAELQGAWKLVSLEVNGEPTDPVGGGTPRWVIKGDKIFYGGKEIIQFTADSSTSPRVIDLKFLDQKQVYEGIYVVEKDTLKVCLNKRAEGAKDRPSAFSTKDQTDWRLLVFEREKAAPMNATEGLKAYAGIVLALDDDKAVVVQAVFKDSPADKAGLKKGDVILKVGTTKATNLETVVQTVRDAKPGEKLEFLTSRDGKEMTATAKVGVFPFNWVAGLE